MSERCSEHRGTSEPKWGYRFLGTIMVPREPLIALPASATPPVCPVCSLMSELQNSRCRGR